MIAHIPTRMKQISIFLLAALLLYASISPAAAQPEGWMARIASAQGEVDVRRSGSLTWEPARMGDPIFPGDMLRVGQRSRAVVVLSNDTVMRLDQNTTLTFPGWEREEMSIIEIIRGAVHFFSRVLNQLKIKTPFVNGAVEGTEFLVRVERDRTTFTTFEGSVRLENARGELFVGKGQRATAAEGEPPRARIPVRARDALSWAIHYPPIIDFRPGDFRHLADPGVAASVSESIAAYRKGDIRRAFEALETVPPYIDDPYLWLYRAGLLLTVGRVAEADVYIQKTFEYQPDSVMALALNAVVAVAQGERETALELARRAVGINPDAAMARVAETYALQANFKVEDALESARTATSLNPDNPLAWALVSELYLATGWVGKALEAARRAVDINPDLSRTQTVLGFAHLTNFNTTDAIAAFTVAIARDQGDPLPRLGLGLATIRVGKLIEGRRHIEVAVALDPTNALLRSYLGKAYFEERRAEKALKQLEMAQEMDPADPTGWFYSAIVKQSVNRPVEALHDFQKAVELNDNRAVYRSRLLLDSDLAARSARLGRIYNDLGFQQAGLVEGWRSVNTDPSNYSAHRLLADLYAALPRHQVARISELLQSQLLQPINITPVQPALVEKNLFILEGAGPTDPSFNEFNPLIVRNRFGVQASGVVGDKNTAGGEVIQSTVWNRFSYSLGAFNFRTDGFRVNNDLDQDVFNAFGQAAVSYKTSVQAEYRSRRTKNGDLPLRFDPENFSDNRRENENIQNLRVGFRHAFSPSSDTLLSLIYGDGNSGTNVQNPIFGVDQSTENDGYMAELQHIFRSASYSLVVGGGWFDGDRRTVSKTRFLYPCRPLIPLLRKTI